MDDLPTAFSQGCDARLAGRPSSDCPYGAGAAQYNWLAGWRHVEYHWGEDVHGRWQVRALPEVAVTACRRSL